MRQKFKLAITNKCCKFEISVLAQTLQMTLVGLRNTSGFIFVSSQLDGRKPGSLIPGSYVETKQSCPGKADVKSPRMVLGKPASFLLGKKVPGKTEKWS